MFLIYTDFEMLVPTGYSLCSCIYNFFFNLIEPLVVEIGPTGRVWEWDQGRIL